LGETSREKKEPALLRLVSVFAAPLCRSLRFCRFLSAMVEVQKSSSYRNYVVRNIEIEILSYPICVLHPSQSSRLMARSHLGQIVPMLVVVLVSYGTKRFQLRVVEVNTLSGGSFEDKHLTPQLLAASAASISM
jgi:hypothetical protein